MQRFWPVMILFFLLSPGCTVTKNYSFSDYEKTRPVSNVEFFMKDKSVISVEAREILMVRSSANEYNIYLKDGKTLSVNKDQVVNVRMQDKDKINKFSNTVFIISTAATVLFLGLVYMAFR